MKYTVSKNNYELESYYQIRKKYIELCNPKNKKELVYITNFSHILINIYFLGNGYSKNTQENFKKTLLYYKKGNKGEKRKKETEKLKELNSLSLHSLIENFIS
jgi:hypothetical protein